MEQPKLLLYNLKNGKGNKIEKLCKRLDISVRHIEKSEYRETVGFLAGLPECEGTGLISDEDPFEEEMLVMVAFTEQLLNTFLKEFRIQHIEPVALKAIVTPQNRTWDSFQLNEELNRERKAFGR
jgi:hypothetical protein